MPASNKLILLILSLKKVKFVQNINDMTALKAPLTEPQLELLQMFTRPVEMADWQNIKTLITKYFAERAIQEANKIWDEEGWDNAKVQELLNSHLRTPYHKK